LEVAALQAVIESQILYREGWHLLPERSGLLDCQGWMPCSVQEEKQHFDFLDQRVLDDE
jgi:hypothetical protein